MYSSKPGYFVYNRSSSSPWYPSVLVSFHAWRVAAPKYVDHIHAMQFGTENLENTQSKSYMLPLIEYDGNSRIVHLDI